MGKTSESGNQEFRKNTGAWEEQPPALIHNRAIIRNVRVILCYETFIGLSFDVKHIGILGGFVCNKIIIELFIFTMFLHFLVAKMSRYS